MSDTLYFGTATPSGTVGDDEWDSFLREVVTPGFPQGFTTWRAQGQWRGASGEVIREATHALQVVHEPKARAEEAMGTIVSRYKSRFGQESVLRVRVPACMAY